MGYTVYVWGKPSEPTNQSPSAHSPKGLRDPKPSELTETPKGPRGPKDPKAPKVLKPSEPTMTLERKMPTNALRAHKAVRA